MTTAHRFTHVQPSALLHSHIAALRRRHVSVAALTGLALLGLVCVELLALAMFLDWWLDLPRPVRLVSLLAQAAVFTWLLARGVALPLLRPPDDDTLALMMEKARPAFRTRLIAALQLARPGALRPGASAALAQALVRETEVLAAPMRFSDIVATDRVKKLGAMALLIVPLALAAFVATRPASIDLLRRVFLARVPVPRKTRVVVANGNQLVGLGDSVRLEAAALGVVPASGRVVVHYRGRRDQEYTLERDRNDRSRFGRTLENVQASFDYRVYLNDGVSETFQVRAVPRPTVATIECEQEYPPYSGLKPTRRALGDLALLAGSTLKLQITATKPLRLGALKLVGLDRQLPLRVDAHNPALLSGTLPIPARDLTGFSVLMLDADGMESRDAAVYRIEIIPDKAPLVRIAQPTRKEELATRTARPFIAFHATDDFALTRIRLCYRLGAASPASPASPQAIELDLGSAQPAAARRQYPWNLGRLRLSEGSLVEYWIEATDNNSATGPGIGRSDPQFLRIVSPDEKLADIWNRAGDYMGSIDDLAGDEEKLNQNLGTLILERTGPRRRP
ncbi:MAG: hypothetical protein JXQ71_02775 [Verrucomicrobia bacterium]|nr:hypothetical protein [Verrucomicrobiota bacterium]